MTLAIALTLAAGALFYGSLQLWIAANYPGERPRWSDVLPFCAALFAAVFRAGAGAGDLQASGRQVEKP